jgi:hypothetical protein|tara:strand:+ start:1085 stop:1285 length:201 start_codon:yes stop_codon:yes gene_type:complete
MTLEELKKLAGVQTNMIPKENISITGTEKARIQRKKGIEPGSEDWFKLWFSRPYLTGAGFRSRKKK